ncbi:MAG TPA: GNAT family N-acetyltransferase [Pyrinomonadaceae bacterium]|nr:GNAT family N-acetyltransferase [Pyrinomonadaceae bacterium]
MPEIETDRLLLRQFTLADLDALAQIFADPEVVKHLGSGQPASSEETEMALRSIIAHWGLHGFGRWATVHRPTRELIGYGGLRSFHGEPELVYLLKKSYWGRGLATELARACLKFGFEERGFERVIAMAKTANAASHRVMEKSGMLFERRAKIYGLDVVRYALSRPAYLSMQESSTFAYDIHGFTREAHQRARLQV